jgi:hypothetical protein
MNTIRFSDSKPLYGKALYQRLLHDQRKWIEHCENRASYLGPNGPAIRRADEDELRRIETRLAELSRR